MYIKKAKEIERREGLFDVSETEIIKTIEGILRDYSIEHNMERTRDFVTQTIVEHNQRKNFVGVKLPNRIRIRLSRAWNAGNSVMIVMRNGLMFDGIISDMDHETVSIAKKHKHNKSEKTIQVSVFTARFSDISVAFTESVRQI